MPTLGATMAAMVAGWLIDAALEPLLGTGVTLTLSLGASTIVFFAAKKWLKDLRGD